VTRLTPIAIIAGLLLGSMCPARGQATQPSSSPLSSLKAWPTLAPGENAAVPVLELARVWGTELRGNPPPIDDAVVKITSPLSDEQIAQARTWLQYWRPHLDKLETIDADSRFDWGPLPPSPFILHMEDDRIEFAIPFVGPLLRVDAMVACHDGDLSRALKRARQLRAISDAVYLRPAEFARAASRGLNKHMCDVLGMISRNEGFAQFAQENRNSLLALIAQLMDDAPARQRFNRIVEFETVVLQDTEQAFASKTLPPRDPKPINAMCSVVARILTDGTQEQLEFYPPILTAFRELIRPDEPYSASFRRSVWRDRIERAITRDLRVYVLARSVAPMLADHLQSSFEFLARRRLAGVALAIALYRLDHAGAWPETLQALVPKYLAQVPLDPLANEPEALRYRRAPHPIAWSTGTNGKDDRAAGVDETRFNPIDIVCRLSNAREE
jgi:hypothetical protein